MFSLRLELVSAFLILAVCSCSSGSNGEDPQGAGGEFSYSMGGAAPETLRLTTQLLSDDPPGSGTDFVFVPESSNILMTLRSGQLALLDLRRGELTTEHVWDFEEPMVTSDACGPTNIALDPEYTENQFIYVTYCPDLLTNRLVRYEFSKDTGPSSPAVIFETNLAENDETWHRFGSLGWETKDVLWMYVGDHFHRENGQDLSNPMGSIVRIIPNRKTGQDGYEPASGNLLEMTPGATKEEIHPAIYAYGFRSPWRGTRDKRGFFWVGDVGLETYEEVDLVTSVGQNFGWGTNEGPCMKDCDGFVEPAAYYDRDDLHPYIRAEEGAETGSKRAVWVGEIYQDPSQDRYQGLMDDVVAFGDLFTGFVRGLRADDDGNVIYDEPIGLLPYVTQWRMGPDGYIYALDLSGQLHVVLLDYTEE